MIHDKEVVGARRAACTRGTAHATHGLSSFLCREIFARSASCGTRIRVSARSSRERSRDHGHFRSSGKLPVPANRSLPLRVAPIRKCDIHVDVLCLFTRSSIPGLQYRCLYVSRSFYTSQVHMSGCWFIDEPKVSTGDLQTSNGVGERLTLVSVKLAPFDRITLVRNVVSLSPRERLSVRLLLRAGNVPR